MDNIHYDYSPQAAERQADTLYNTVAELHGETGHPLYLLFDPVLRLEHIDTPLMQALVRRQPAPVPLPHQSLSEPDYPWLVPLDLNQEYDQALLRLSISVALEELHPDALEQGLGRAICGWLTSPAKPEDIVKQLGHTAIQRTGINRHILMRYYDPAVHNLLWTLLSELQQRRMGGMLSGWIYPDGDGQVVIRRFQPAPMLYSTFSLGLNDKQCDFILYTSGVTCRALRGYRQAKVAEARYSELAAASHISQALVRLTGHPALQQATDKERFALQVLQYHPQIDRHPAMADLLDHNTFSGDVSWTTRTLNILPETWRRYAEELMAPQPMENNV
jgi:hypothetical protein